MIWASALYHTNPIALPVLMMLLASFSDSLYECSGGIINMLIWLYKWIMLEYIDSKSKGKIETIDKKFIVRVNNKHFKQLKGAIDIVNQARTEELEDERILTIAEEEKNKYQMLIVVI